MSKSRYVHVDKRPPCEPTLQAILAWQIQGNAYSDGPLFTACHTFLMDPTNSMEDKIQAVQKIDDTMGLGCTCGEEEVYDYIASFQNDS